MEEITLQQKARTNLRERFLKALSGLSGRSFEFRTYECTIVKGKFQICDAKFENICVQELETPMHKLNNGILRVGDLVSFKTTDVNVEVNKDKLQ